jgi:hypothetical protein
MRAAASVLAFAVLAACNAGASTGRAAFVPTVDRTSSGDLLYISEYGGRVVDVFSYPQDVFLGTLSGLIGRPEGECVDNAGNVWVVEVGGHPVIQEFAHGKNKPKASLSDQGTNPYACSVDPVSGDLAVSSEFGVSSADGSLAVWKKAKGTPTVYTDPRIELMLWCGYDNQGNLFVDGLPPSDGRARTAFTLAELRKGSQGLTNITLGKVRSPGNLQWDGTEMTVGDSAHVKGSAIDRLSISGTSAKITGVTLLERSDEVYGSWIEGDAVIGPDDGKSLSTVQIWSYPAGGEPLETLSKGSSLTFDGPFGAVVSSAPKEKQP